MAAPLPDNEQERLAALRRLCIVDGPSDDAFDAIARVAAATFAVPIALVSLIDEDRQLFKARVGMPMRETPRDLSFCAYALHSAELTIVLDATLDARFAHSPFVVGEPCIRFYAGAPLLTADGLCLGTLCIVDSIARDSMSPREVEVLRDLARLAALRIQSMQSRHYVDALTLLPNRHRFLADLALHAEHRHDGDGRPVTAVAIDVCGADYARDMRNALGHRYADGYVVAALARLLQALPASTGVYRIGDTCFGLIDGSVGDQPPVALFERVVHAFSATVDHGGIPHTTQVTMGSIPLRPDDDPADLLRSLIAVTDDARRRGARWGVYDAAVDVGQRRTFQLLAALSVALVDDAQLALHYQPRIRLSDGACVGVEALLRWTHPDMGRIPPKHFIEAAEKTALIGRITAWVLDAALEQASAWRQAGFRFVVGINVSAVDLEQNDFVDQLAMRLQRHGVDPTGIEIEFTESAMVREPDRLTVQLDRLRGLGLQLAIDDFGVGYSNLSYLKRIPATVLKIDQSFVFSLMDDAKDRAIVPSMIKLGHDLGCRVVAEGVETAAVLAVLQAWGCDEAQGYYIARPMAASALCRWLAGSANVDIGRRLPAQALPD